MPPAAPCMAAGGGGGVGGGGGGRLRAPTARSIWFFFCEVVLGVPLAACASEGMAMKAKRGLAMRAK
eukprot:13105881-Alexandrium_andersonii.AAC.1